MNPELRDPLAECEAPETVKQAELRRLRTTLVIERDRNRRARVGWRFASEALSAAQRYIAILEDEIAKLQPPLPPTPE